MSRVIAFLQRNVQLSKIIVLNQEDGCQPEKSEEPDNIGHGRQEDG